MERSGRGKMHTAYKLASSYRNTGMGWGESKVPSCLWTCTLSRGDDSGVMIGRRCTRFALKFWAQSDAQREKHPGLCSVTKTVTKKAKQISMLLRQIIRGTLPPFAELGGYFYLLVLEMSIPSFPQPQAHYSGRSFLLPSIFPFPRALQTRTVAVRGVTDRGGGAQGA